MRTRWKGTLFTVGSCLLYVTFQMACMRWCQQDIYSYHSKWMTAGWTKTAKWQGLKYGCHFKIAIHNRLLISPKINSVIFQGIMESLWLGETLESPSSGTALCSGQGHLHQVAHSHIQAVLMSPRMEIPQPMGNLCQCLTDLTVKTTCFLLVFWCFFQEAKTVGHEWRQ